MVRSVSTFVILAFTLLGCEQPEPLVRNGVALDGEAIELSVYGGSERALVRAVNALGVASVGVPGSFQLDSANVTVPLDSAGYGLLDLELGVHSVAAASGHEQVYGYDGAWSGLGVGVGERSLGSASEVARGTRGVMAAVDNEVWWVGPGLPAHPVAVLPDANVDGVRSTQIDQDGVYDGIIWGGDTVLLLRGRADGGQYWGFGLQAPGWTVEGAAVGDVDDDGRADLVVAWTAPDGHYVQIWAGDGAWSFYPSHERQIEDRPVDVSIGNDRGTGEMIATVLVEGGAWQRFVAVSPGEYLITGPPLNVATETGSTVWSGGDINQDGSDEVVVMAPRVDDAEREVYIWDLTNNAVNFLRAAPIGATLAFADANQDTFEQMWILDQKDSMLTHLGWNGSQYLYQSSSPMPEVAPMGLSDFTDDGVVDLLVAGSMWAWWEGWIDEEADGRWRPRRQLASATDAKLQGPIAWLDVDGDASTDEVVGVTALDEGVALTLWDVHGDDPSNLWTTALVALGSEEVVDLATCGADVWVLSANHVVHVDMARRRIIGSNEVESALAVACGEGPDGVLAVVTGEKVRLELSGVAEVLNRVGGEDLGAVIVDRGDGPEIVSCDQPCIAWPYGDEGQVAIVLDVGDGLQIDVGGEEPSLRSGGGALSIQDVDGDGRLDLVTSMGLGHVGVIRSTGDGFGLGTFGHTDHAWRGTAVFGDTNGDGDRELLMRRDGFLVHPIER